MSQWVSKGKCTSFHYIWSFKNIYLLLFIRSQETIDKSRDFADYKGVKRARKKLKEWKKSGRKERVRASPFLEISSRSDIIKQQFPGYEKIKVVRRIYIFLESYSFFLYSYPFFPKWYFSHQVFFPFFKIIFNLYKMENKYPWVGRKCILLVGVKNLLVYYWNI